MKTAICSTRSLTKQIRVFAAVLFLTLLASLVPSVKAHAATRLSCKVNAVTKLSYSNAQLNATIGNPDRIRLRRCGFILYNSRGKAMGAREDKINCTLKSFNAWFNLNTYRFTLSPSTTYYYRFYLIDQNGKLYYKAPYKFTTPRKPSPAVSAVQSAVNKAKQAASNVVSKQQAVSRKLPYNSSLIKAIGAQPKRSSYCSVYAIAYARVVAGYGKSNPLKYWDNKNGAVWSRGSMKSVKYNTQQAALKRAYDEVKKGKPCILNIYDPVKAKIGHYVTVVGYTNVTNVNKLSMSNFIIICPGSAKEMNLGTYRQMKPIKNKKTNQIQYQVCTF